MQDRSPLYLSETPNATEKTEILDVDAVFVATGYKRDLHETLLGDARHLMPGGDLKDAKWEVGRNYRVNFAHKSISEDAGVWLQGCCETTHGVSFPNLFSWLSLCLLLQSRFGGGGWLSGCTVSSDGASPWA